MRYIPIKLVASFIVFSLTMISGTTFGQSFSIGVVPAYSFDLEESGLNIRAYYNIGNKVCFGPEVMGFREHVTIDGEETETLKVSEVNFNGHYIFHISEQFGVYAAGGLNYTIEKEELTSIDLTSGETHFEEHTENAFGVNAGAGLHYEHGRFIFFLEYQHVISEIPDNVGLLGVFFTFGGEGEKSEHGHD